MAAIFHARESSVQNPQDIARSKLDIAIGSQQTLDRLSSGTWDQDGDVPTRRSVTTENASFDISKGLSASRSGQHATGLRKPIGIAQLADATTPAPFCVGTRLRWTKGNGIPSSRSA
jgi:hypothetical protein